MGYETAKIITEEGIEGIGRYYSVYRGIVVNNSDTEKKMNRVEVCIPEVMGGTTAWAYPKGQHGSISGGFKFLTPKIGDIVFITFEYGDPTKPLWEYHGWGINQVPQPLDGPNKMGIVTPEGNLIVIDDDNGTLNLYFNGNIVVSSEANIVISSEKDINVSSGDSVILNTGENGGVINIFQLTEKLNQTIRELEQLRSMFNSHVHSGVTTGPGSSGPTVTQVIKPFSQFVVDDYEDKTCIH